MEESKKMIIKYTYGIGMIILGLLFNYFKLGVKDFAFGSVGNWLLYVGFFSMIFVTIRLIWKPKKKLVDERMYFISTKANRITFLALLIIAFIIMIIDGIKPITIPYYLFMSYLICGMLVIYVAAYKILLRHY